MDTSSNPSSATGFVTGVAARLLSWPHFSDYQFARQEKENKENTISLFKVVKRGPMTLSSQVPCEGLGPWKAPTPHSVPPEPFVWTLSCCSTCNLTLLSCRQREQVRGRLTCITTQWGKRHPPSRPSEERTPASDSALGSRGGFHSPGAHRR